METETNPYLLPRSRCSSGNLAASLLSHTRRKGKKQSFFSGGRVRHSGLSAWTRTTYCTVLPYIYLPRWSESSPLYFSAYTLFSCLPSLLLRYSVTISLSMDIANMLQYPVQETRTPSHSTSDSSTSISPVLAPRPNSGVVKSKPRRRQTKAACMACRRRKSKVGPPSVHACYPLHEY